MVRHSKANRRGFTLVECTVVLTVLVLVAALISPSLIGMRASSDRRTTISGIRRIAETARVRAIQTGTTTQVIYDESAKELQVQDVDDQGSATTAITVPLLAGVEPQKFELQSKESNASDFKLAFTPDGKSVSGGIEFQDFSIFVDSNGFSQFLTGSLPDPTDRQWQAGDLEQRTQ
jgi:prepilin-type N-terminal cleavage/methylation domain-containing protein